MALADTLLLIAPELASIDEARRDGYISLAEGRVSATVFGNLYEQAVAYLAAHLATGGTRGPDYRPAKSLKEGDLQITYGDAGGSGLEATTYGAEYLRLQRAVVFPVL